MIERIIKIKINNLTIEELKKLNINNNLNLNNQELNYLYEIIKKDWNNFLYKDPNPILKNIKNNINQESYNKLYNLYIYYKNKYQNYL
jgi:hypothetical protein